LTPPSRPGNNYSLPMNIHARSRRVSYLVFSISGSSVNSHHAAQQVRIGTYQNTAITARLFLEKDANLHTYGVVGHCNQRYLRNQ
jgi:hypothetical protein